MSLTADVRLPMGKLQLPGTIVIVVLFFALLTFLGSKVTIGGASVDVTGNHSATSITSYFWHTFTGAIGCTNPTINNPAGITP